MRRTKTPYPGGINVMAQDEAGQWQTVGAIILPRGDSSGGFRYDSEYHGPPLSPDLDYLSPRQPADLPDPLFFELSAKAEQHPNPVDHEDLHPLFKAALPGRWGSMVMTSHSAQYARSSPAEQLVLLGSVGAWRSGGLRFESQSDNMNNSAQGLDALTALHDSVNQFLVSVTEHHCIPRDAPVGLPSQRWSLSSNGGAAPKVAVYHDGHEWVGKMSREAIGTFEETRVEAGMLAASRDAGLTTVDAVLHELQSGQAVLLTRRFDAVPLVKSDAPDNDDDDADPADGVRRIHKIPMFVAMDLLQTSRSDYTLMADFLRVNSSRPDDDVRELYGRMVFNAYSDNTDDHLGQFELLQDGARWTLAPNYDLTIPSPGTEAPHAITMDGDERPTYSAEWLDNLSDRFGIERGEGREIATRVLAAIERLPEYWASYGVPESTVAQLMPSIQTPGHSNLKLELDSLATGHAQRQTPGLAVRSIIGPR